MFYVLDAGHSHVFCVLDADSRVCCVVDADIVMCSVFYMLTHSCVLCSIC